MAQITEQKVDGRCEVPDQEIPGEVKMVDNARYKILRYKKKGGKPRVVARGLTLEEARRHCQDPKTHGKDWFDGFTRDT